MGAKINDDPIDLHLLLGKRLEQGYPTMETIWRVSGFHQGMYLHEEQRKADHLQIATLSGGMGEAAVMRIILYFQQAIMFQPRSGGFIGLVGRGVELLETEAPNSRLNILFAVRNVRARGYNGVIRLHLYTSPYHGEGIAELRYRLPSLSPFSFGVAGTIADVIMHSTPYLYPGCRIPAIEWLAQAYLARQSLRLTWENLRGLSGIPGQEESHIPAGTRDEFGLAVEPLTTTYFQNESVDRIAAALDCFKTLLGQSLPSTPVLADRIGNARDKLESFVQIVGTHLSWLRGNAGREITILEVDEWQERAKALELYLNPTHARDVDPDLPAGLWEALAYTVGHAMQVAPGTSSFVLAPTGT